MVNVLLRTILLYILIVFLMRLTGKRQIGQLELTELVTAFMISELAAYPISNNATPLLYGVIPAVTLVCLEVFFSYASMKFRPFRRALTGNAVPLVRNGRLDQVQMSKARITLEELVSASRMAGISCLADVSYAFLEPSGTISVLPKSEAVSPSAKALGQSVNESGAGHSLILDGEVDDRTLKTLGLGRQWLLHTLRSNGFSRAEEIFYMEINDQKELFFVRKEDKAPKNEKGQG